MAHDVCMHGLYRHSVTATRKHIEAPCTKAVIIERSTATVNVHRISCFAILIRSYFDFIGATSGWGQGTRQLTSLIYYPHLLHINS